MPFHEPISITSPSTSTSSNLGAVIARRTRPLVSVFQDSAKSYSLRQPTGIYRAHMTITGTSYDASRTRNDVGDDELHESAFKRSKIFINIRKSLSITKRPATAMPSIHSRTYGIDERNTRVLYSTPAERSRSRSIASPQVINPNHTSISPPTVAQIAMGLHTSRTPHHRAIRLPRSGASSAPRRPSTGTSPPTMPTRPALKTPRSVSASNDLRMISTTSSISSNTTLSTPNSSFNGLWKAKGHAQMFFSKGKKTRTGLGPSSIAESSTSSRKTVRFNDAASM